MNKRVASYLLAIFLSCLPLVFAALPSTNITLDSSLDKELQVPNGLQLIAKVLFGINEVVSLSAFIILIVLWLISFVVFTNILKLVPFLNNGKAWIAAALITTLFGLAGVFRSFATFFLNLGTTFTFLEKWSAGALLFSVILIIVAGIILAKILHFIKEYTERVQAHQEGTKVGVELGFLGKMREMFKFTRNI